MAKIKPSVPAPATPSEPIEIGLAELVGKSVCIYCGVYIYTGRLVALGLDAAKLEDASIVYDTGPLTSKTWADAQALPGPHWWVSFGAIESFGLGKEEA